jgi:hypothetical protein
LARLSGLLKPTLELLWVQDVVKLNAGLVEEGQDVANLVPACERCNSDKSNALPAVATVTRVLGRDRAVLDQIGSEIGWPVQYERVCRAARGLYRGSPEGTPTWQSRGTFTALQLERVPWLEQA